MVRTKRLVGTTTVLLLLTTACGGSGDESDDDAEEPYHPPQSDDDRTFEDYGVNAEGPTAEQNRSTFALDVDTGSYAITRAVLTDRVTTPR